MAARQLRRWACPAVSRRVAAQLLLRPGGPPPGTARGAAAAGKAGAGGEGGGGPGPARLHRYGLRAAGKGAGAAVRFDGGQTAQTDVPRAMGGKDAAPQPVELLLAALVGCEQATAAYVCRHLSRRVRLDSIDFRYEAERDPRGALHLPLAEDPPAPAR